MLIDTYIVNIEWGLSTKLTVKDRWAQIAAIKSKSNKGGFKPLPCHLEIPLGVYYNNPSVK